MKKSIDLWQFVGFAVASLLGTLLHFSYEWFAKASWIAPFSGVNESTWEHMKLLFWPMLIYAVIQGFFFRDRENFWCIKLRGILIGVCLIPLLFYGYNGIVGKSPDWLNIAIFFISAAIAYIYEARLLKSDTDSHCPKKLALGMVCTLALLFIIFTFWTPHLEIFKDPLTGAYGI